MAAFRPALLIALLAGSIFFAWRAMDQTYVSIPLSASPSEKLALSIQTRLGDNANAHWQELIGDALAPTRQGLPDLQRAESVARSLTQYINSEDLALMIATSNGARELSLEAGLRAVPSWERALFVSDHVDARIVEGREQGLEPGELVFADQRLRERLAYARGLYSPTLNAAEAWFSDPNGRALALAGVPGFANAPASSIIYDDTRDLIIRSCAFVETLGRRVGPCRVAFIPKPAGDGLGAGLALTTLSVDGPRALAARLVKAALVQGELDRAFWSPLILGSDAELGAEASLAATMVLMRDAANVYSQPARYTEMAITAAREFEQSAQIDIAARDRALSQLGVIAQQQGALASARLIGLVHSHVDLDRLAVLSRENPGRLLGLWSALGEDLIEDSHIEGDLRIDFADWSQTARRDAALALVLFLSAIALISLVLIAGFTRRHTGALGGFERFDRGVTLLILGRES